MLPTIHALNRLPLFDVLSEEEKGTLAQNSRIVHYPTGSTIFNVNDKSPYLFGVADGTVKIHLSSRYEKEVVLNLVGTGEILGEIHLLDGCGHSASAKAVEPVQLLRIELATMQQMMLRSGELHHVLRRLAVQRFRTASHRQAVLASANVFERVPYFLMDIAMRYKSEEPISIPMRLTQSDLAALMGASRYQINKCIGYLQDKHIIRIERKQRLTILQFDLLRHQCDLFYDVSSYGAPHTGYMPSISSP